MIELKLYRIWNTRLCMLGNHSLVSGYFFVERKEPEWKNTLEPSPQEKTICGQLGQPVIRRISNLLGN